MKSDAYYMGYIEWARLNNIINGVGNEIFAPDKSITREQMAVIFCTISPTLPIDYYKISGGGWQDVIFSILSRAKKKVLTLVSSVYFYLSQFVGLLSLADLSGSSSDAGHDLGCCRQNHCG
jgi:hypothetical protein